MVGMRTRSASPSRVTRSQLGIRATYAKSSDPWKSKKTSTERGKTATAHAETPIGRPRGPRGSRAPPHHLAEEPLGPEDQDQDQDREGEDVLVLGTERACGEKRQVGSGEGLEQAEHEATEHRAGNVADAA